MNRRTISNYVRSGFSKGMNQNLRLSTTNNKNIYYNSLYSNHLNPIKRCKGVLFDIHSFTRSDNNNSSKLNRNYTINATSNSSGDVVDGGGSNIGVRDVNDIAGNVNVSHVSNVNSDFNVNNIDSSGINSSNYGVNQNKKILLNVLEILNDFSSIEEFNEDITHRIKKNPQKLTQVERMYSKLNDYGITPNTTTYNIILDAINNLKNEPRAVSKMVNYYHRMIENQVVPNLYTHSILIKQIYKRDHEINNQKIFWAMRLKLNPKDRYASKGLDNFIDEEKNIDLALEMLKGTFNINGFLYDGNICDKLLFSFAFRGKVMEALNIFEIMEKNKIVSPLTYGYLVRLYGTIGDIQSALECYQEYLKQLPSYHTEIRNPLAIYNQLIYAHINCGDLKGATNVMDELIPQNNLEPNDLTYYYLIKYLCERDYDKATDIFNIMMDKKMKIHHMTLSVYIYATFKYRIDNLNGLLDELLNSGQVFDNYLTKVFISHYSEVESISKSLDIVARILLNLEKSLSSIERFYQFQDLLDDLIIHSSVSLSEAIDFKLKFYYRSFDISRVINDILIRKYNGLKNESKHFSQLESLSNEQISGLFDSFGFKKSVNNTHDEYVNGLLSLMDDFIATGVIVPYHTIKRYADALKEIGDEKAIKKWNELYLTMTKICDEKKEVNSGDDGGNLDQMKGRNPTMDEINKSSELASICRGNDIKPGLILAGIKQMLNDNLLPTPELVSQAIRNLGKQNRLEEAQEIYKLFLGFYTNWNKQVREKALHYVYNSMLIAYASNNMADEAYKVHDEIIKKGWHPDAGAYADLLVAEKEDDPYDISKVLQIYSEIKNFKVRPSIYLCNVLISKFGKALRIDLVQQVYDDMKNNQFLPNVVTYGALISAYTKAKHEKKALELFQQLENSNIQTRITQYNAMMQYYTTDVPNRKKALVFYHKSQQRNLEPNSHTYKILIDLYATIEPYDMKSALDILEDMKKKGITPQATHYASLIYAYGCCQKDLNSALDVFHSLKSSYNIIPNGEVFKALLEALVNNEKIEEAEKYYDEISKENIKSTSIDNLFIKSYGELGQLEKAEKIFNSMGDFSKDPSTYGEMIKVYASNGKIEKAKEIANIIENKNYSEIIKSNINDLLSSSSLSSSPS
ncbi:13295_t:CDS:2 [Entrophospora sp. SA101]|nr:13295_t:CDS:2 [Entrophospora sp. SA101]